MLVSYDYHNNAPKKVRISYSDNTAPWAISLSLDRGRRWHKQGSLREMKCLNKTMDELLFPWFKDNSFPEAWKTRKTYKLKSGQSLWSESIVYRKGKAGYVNTVRPPRPGRRKFSDEQMLTIRYKKKNEPAKKADSFRTYLTKTVTSEINDTTIIVIKNAGR